MEKKRKRGFTLIEMIVVIAILAILSIALIPLLSNLIDKSRVSRFLADSDLVRTAALSFQADVGSLDNSIFITNTDDITNTSLVVNTNNLGTWDGPYLEEGVDTHPWGGQYGLFFSNVDNSAPPPNNPAKTLDLTLIANNINEAGEQTPIAQAGEIVNELNKKITGDSSSNTNRAAVGFASTEIQLVVVSNVSD